MEFPRFTGNCPNNVSKDAKYAVRFGGGRPVVSMIYNTRDGERFYLATVDHQPLVAMVNTIKEEYGNASLGPFYINEYRQVIVPVGQYAHYYYAGEYMEDLEFNFNGGILSGAPLNETGQPLQPGVEWRGPHAGIPYKLKANGRDIAYIVATGPNSTREVTLSRAVGADQALRIAKRIREFKDAGGRFYVNEWRAIFAPVKELDEYKYIYVGHLGQDDPWFPKPRIV